LLRKVVERAIPVGGAFFIPVTDITDKKTLTTTNKLYKNTSSVFIPL
jgi:hypothetical protein